MSDPKMLTIADRDVVLSALKHAYSRPTTNQPYIQRMLDLHGRLTASDFVVLTDEQDVWEICKALDKDEQWGLAGRIRKGEVKIR